MTAVEAVTGVLTRDDDSTIRSPEDLAAAAFLVHYSGWTLEAHRHDLRTHFQWAADKFYSPLCNAESTARWNVG